MESHTSVLLEEALHFLEPRPGSCIVDATLGLGGHAERILEKLGPKGRLIGFDRDPQALKQARLNLNKYKDNVLLVHGRFSRVADKLSEIGGPLPSGMLLDLGVSSFQLDQAARGFSFREDGPLDMRMDPSEELGTAADLVNRSSKHDLLQILWTYGEERYARRIVNAIERARERRKVETTADLADIVARAVPSGYRHGRLHPATRTFQALRIAVNSEMKELEDFLKSALDVLDAGGRLVIISFHSLEDRAVKNAFRRWKTQGFGAVLTKKPVTASNDETRLNPRSRSAKLRAFQKSPVEASK